MLSSKEYEIFKYFIIKNRKKIEYSTVLNLLVFFKPENNISVKIKEEEVTLNIVPILIKIEKILANTKLEELNKEIIKLFNFLWNNS